MKYRIDGTPFPVAICTLDPGETMITERGSMAWMTPNMEMETSMNGGVGKALGRMFTRESVFQNRYTARGGPGEIAFASSFPGSIMPFQIAPGSSMILQKSAFLASETGVELSLHFQKRFGAGLVGGEGFVLQRVSGNGIVFVELDGHTVQYTLRPGESMLLDTGYLAMMDESVQMSIETIKGVKNVLFGGEGLFNTRVTGPGRIWIQTMPLSAFAGSIVPYIPSKG